MTDCLSDIQIEDVLAGSADASASGHLETCAACRQRVEAAKALQQRLRGAFQSVHAPADAAGRIRAATVEKTPAHAERRRPRPWAIRHWGTLAAAASLLVVASVILIASLGGPTSAEAAAAELVEIHQANMAGHGDLVTHGTHDQTQAYLHEKLGFKPAVPDETGENRIRACCVSRFLGRRAGNMVVEGPHGPISVIVSDANAKQLQTGRSIVKAGRTYWVCPMKGFFTVAVQEGRLIYCAVGEEEPQHLADLLDGILDGRPGDAGN